MYAKNYSAKFSRQSRFFLSIALIVASGGLTSAVYAQQLDFRVDAATKRMEMVVNSSRMLTLDSDIPRVLVANPDLLRVVPISPNQIQVSALKPGVTQINLWDRQGSVRTVDVIVYADSRQLEMILQTEFPKAAVRVRPLGNSLLLTGLVDRPETVVKLVEVAEDFYPKVINNISVSGVQQVALHVKIMEVSRNKLRSLGADWAYLNGGGGYIIESAAGLISTAASGATNVVGTGLDTVKFGIVDGNDEFFGFIRALRTHNVVKVLAEPTLTAISGRPASFHEGGEFPVLIPSGLGTTAVEYKQFGTRVDFVPIVLGNGNIRLEVRPQVSEIDTARGIELDGISVPGLRDRSVDTAVEMRSGQTLAIAGLIQNRVETENVGLPWVSDLPWAGALFRRTQNTSNEIELLILVQPVLVDALDPHQVPSTWPGQHTTSPTDIDMGLRGYVEVPRCCPDVNCNANPNYTNGGYTTIHGTGNAPVQINPQFTSPAPVVPSGAIRPADQRDSAIPHNGHRRSDTGVIEAPTGYPMSPPQQVSPQSNTAPGFQTSARAHSSHYVPRPNYRNQPTSRHAPVLSHNQVSPGPNLFGPTGYDELSY